MNFSVVASVVPVKLKINLQPMVHLKKTLPFITEIITFNRIEMVYMYLVLQMLNTVS